ncbi:MAG: hypothetical protein JOZ41_15170 [Chloroflexi bacterium]|nr:hypothetical protein [Chloroflexota bacterium]
MKSILERLSGRVRPETVQGLVGVVIALIAIVLGTITSSVLVAFGAFLALLVGYIVVSRLSS